MKCIYHPESVKKWDKNVKAMEFIPVEGSKTHGFNYSASKKIFTFDSRDFYEKTFMFHHNGKIYKYSCAVENDE